MGHQLLILTCIAVLAASTIDAINNDRFKRSSPYENSKEQFVSKEGFLMGERTPVWLAKNPNNGDPVVYEKLRLDTMKRAMMKWKKNGGQSVKLDPSIDAYSKTKTIDDKKNPDDNRDVIYLSVLVVMDYGGNWNNSGDAKKNETTIESMLTYAMAFWNSVDLALRFLQPVVRIRVVGIVIGYDRDATPYIYDSVSAAGDFNPELAMFSMHEYWDKLSETHKDFPKKAYDCVVTLTELRPREVIHYDFDEMRRGLLKNPIKIFSIIMNDDRLFHGVNGVAHELLEIITELPISARQTKALLALIILKTYAGKPYLQFHYYATDINEFYVGLSKPKEHHHPGKPLETILPSHMTTDLQLCASRDPKFTQVCPEPTTCVNLYCAVPGQACKSIGASIAGSACDNQKKICLGGECVDKDTLEIH